MRFSLTGPFSPSRRLHCDAYPDRADLVRALARVLNAETRSLADAGAELLQIEEPFLAGHPERVGLAVEALNMVVEDLPVTWARHVCYGNRYGWDGVLGVGVLDVKTAEVEPVDVVERRIERALRVVPPDRMIVTPGPRHLPAPAAREKLRVMTTAAASVRDRLQKEHTA